MTPKLTERQQRVLDAITGYIREHGYPPSRQDICNALGFKNSNAAQYHIKALVAAGAIEVQPGISRGIRILEKN